MEFILAQEKHLEEMCRITAEAKAQLKKLGLDQWQSGYPSREIWEEDIRRKDAWLAVEGDQVLGVFAFQIGPDVSYGEIEGQWLTDGEYAAMHRVCVSDGCKGKGIAGQMFAFGFERAEKLGYGSVRIDTHPGNAPMQRALKKAGFVPCGTIRLRAGAEKGAARIGFERILKEKS